MNCIASFLCSLCCEIESVCGFATWFWLVPLSTGNIAQLKSRGPWVIIPWAGEVPLHGHRAPAAEERRQHGAAGEAGRRGVDALVDVDHVVHVLHDRLLGSPVTEVPLAALEIEVLPAVVERHRLDRRGRRAEAPTDAEAVARS